MKVIAEAIKAHQEVIREPMTTVERLDYISDMILAAHVESAEFLQHIPWRKWRNRGGDINTPAALEELADAIIFMLNAVNTFGEIMDIDALGELERVILGKIKKNFKRLEEGPFQEHKTHM